MLYRLAMLALFAFAASDQIGGGNSWPTRILAVLAIVLFGARAISAAVRYFRFTYGDRVRQRLGRRPRVSSH